eukprot:11447885-Prorocentrum_lima.AAC.1
MARNTTKLVGACPRMHPGGAVTPLTSSKAGTLHESRITSGAPPASWTRGEGGETVRSWHG